MRIKAVLADTNGFGVILESSHSFRVAPEVHEFREGTSLALLIGKTTGRVGVVSWTVRDRVRMRMRMTSMGSIRRCTCSSRCHHSIMRTGSIWGQTSLGRVLVVLILMLMLMLMSILRRALRARGVMLMAEHISCCCNSNAGTNTICRRLWRLAGTSGSRLRVRS